MHQQKSSFLFFFIGAILLWVLVPFVIQKQIQKSYASSTQITFTIFLHGIGQGGDSENVTSIGNLNPLRKQRTLSVRIMNNQDQLVSSQNVPITYNPIDGNFSGSAPFANLTSGTYTITMTTDRYLRSTTGVQTITAGVATILAPVYLTVGDIVSDNQINIADYNTLMDCYSDFRLAKACSNQQKTLADLNDDGNVNQLDYNLFIREITNHR